MKCDELKRHHINEVMDMHNLTRGEMGYSVVYYADDVDAAIAELKDKCQMHDFFWEGCGFAKRGFKNTIAVSNAYDELEGENTKLKAEIESLKASHYAEMVDAGMRERRLKRAFYKACANWAHIAVAFFSSYVNKNRWRWMELKCRAKAEGYK